ncbi:alpha/beta fold hydrolase [Bradyrhizobium betae]
MDQTVPILLVPGLASSARIYAPVIPALWRFGPVMVANHIRDASMAAIARRVLSEAPPRFALAGHSMGGYIAFEIMRQAPERVVKLALINTQARPDTPEATARRRGLMERARCGELRAAREEMFPELVHPRAATIPAFAGSWMSRATMSAWKAICASRPRSSRGWISRPTLATIKCPTLVLTGDQDNTIPNAFSKEMAEGIAGARLVILERCGHLPQPEQPEATARALAEWLQTQVVSGARTA